MDSGFLYEKEHTKNVQIHLGLAKDIGNNMGKVSIITPAYNASQFIAMTIESVQKQSHQDWEMIIADDISTDDTAQIVKNLSEKDPRIQFHQLPQKGPGCSPKLCS
jgi:cellulose synthase/poly-beta-1,6-N-acetylglucosamine synthase-like glycosyltransferase